MKAKPIVIAKGKSYKKEKHGYLLCAMVFLFLGSQLALLASTPFWVPP